MSSSLTNGAAASGASLARVMVDRSVIRYASLRRANRSLHVFTGANRVLGTSMAAALSKHSMALPMAVSSWNTERLPGSRGLTVFLFLMRGSLSVPPDASNVLFSVFKLSHRLFVLKYECRSMFSKAGLSSSAHIALSRRISRPSDFRLARCPPFLSLAVRLHTSIMNEYPDVAKCDSSTRSSVAPRLSELDTNKYSTPRASSLSSMPLPTSDG